MVTLHLPSSSRSKDFTRSSGTPEGRGVEEEMLETMKKNKILETMKNKMLH